MKHYCWLNIKLNISPVFPDVGSMIVMPGDNFPSLSASSTILNPILSFTLPPALKNSHFATKIKFFHVKQQKSSWNSSIKQFIFIWFFLFLLNVSLQRDSSVEKNITQLHLHISHFTPADLPNRLIFTIGVRPIWDKILGKIFGWSKRHFSWKWGESPADFSRDQVHFEGTSGKAQLSLRVGMTFWVLWRKLWSFQEKQGKTGFLEKMAKIYEK